MNGYSSIVLEHFASPRNVGRLADASAVGTAGRPGHGNYVVLFLQIEDGRICQVKYLTHGCPAVIASGSMLTVLLQGKDTATAEELTAEQLLESLGRLPLGKEHGARLAIEALQDGLREYRKHSPGEEVDGTKNAEPIG